MKHLLVAFSDQIAVARQLALAAYLLSSNGQAKLHLLEEREDGSADHTLYYTKAVWAAKKVMRYLGGAVALEPEELRQETYRQSSVLLEAYRDDV